MLLQAINNSNIIINNSTMVHVSALPDMELEAIYIYMRPQVPCQVMQIHGPLYYY